MAVHVQHIPFIMLILSFYGMKDEFEKFKDEASSSLLILHLNRWAPCNIINAIISITIIIITKLWTIITILLLIIIYTHFASKQVDKVRLLVAEKVDEDLVLHLREGDADGGPTEIIYFFSFLFSSFPPFILQRQLLLFSELFCKNGWRMVFRNLMFFANNLTAKCHRLEPIFSELIPKIVP